MEPIKDHNAALELQLQIEELEGRIAPDGGETVLPLAGHGHPHHQNSQS